MHVVAISKSEFARRAGVTKAAVSIALSKGRIVAEPDGSMDPERPENATYLVTDKRQRRQARRVHGEKVGGSPPQRPLPAAVLPEPGGVSRPPGGEGGSPGESYDEADRRKKIAEANKVELAVASERRELVPRLDVESIFNKLIAVLTQQTLAIPQRCSPTLCGELGVDEAEKVVRCQAFLDKEIRTGVELQKQLMLDYLRELQDAAV